MTDKEERIIEILRRFLHKERGSESVDSSHYREGFFLGIFQDLISNVLFEKKNLTNVMILIYYYTGEFCCFKIIKI